MLQTQSLLCVDQREVLVSAHTPFSCLTHKLYSFSLCEHTQTRVKWANLFPNLVRTPLGCLTAGDRAALLVVGDLSTVVTAIYKSCTGCSVVECPEAEILVEEVGVMLCDGDLFVLI